MKIGGEGRTNDDVSEFADAPARLSLFFQNVRLDRTEASTNAETKIPVQKFIITGRVRVLTWPP